MDGPTHVYMIERFRLGLIIPVVFIWRGIVNDFEFEAKQKKIITWKLEPTPK